MKKVVFFLGMLFFLGACSGNNEEKEIKKFLENLGVPTEIETEIDLISLYEPLGLTIEWKSADEAVIDNLGNVYIVSEDKTVQLTASISYNEQTINHTYNVTVKKNDEMYFPYFQNIYNIIESKIPRDISKNLKLYFELEEFKDVKIEYTSSDEAVLKKDGTITPDFFVDKDITFSSKITYKNYTRLFEKEVTVKKMSSYAKMPEVVLYVKDFMAKNDINNIKQLPLRFEKYDLDLRWYCPTGEIVNPDGTFNSTLSKMKTKITCEIKIDFYIETVSFDYESNEMTQQEKIVYFDGMMNQVYGKESYKYLPLLHLKDLVIQQGIVDINMPNRDGRKKPVPSQKRLNDAGYTVMPNTDNVLWIVIHDTGNPAPGANAQMHNQFINSNPSTGVSWHYTVDDRSIYQHIPDDEIAYHAGDGTREAGNGNCNGIGIEMCINPEGDYELTLKHTAKLVAKLLRKYNLKMTSIQQHFYFSGKDCPHTLRSTNRWNEFLEMIKIEYHALTLLEDPSNISYSYIMPEGVYMSPFEVLRASMEEHIFILKIEVNIFDVKKEFSFNIKLKA